jgi:hypothetical protein
VHVATRFQHLSSTLIDHICCKNEPHNLKIGTIVTDLSDHLPNFVMLNAIQPKVNCKSGFRRKFTIEAMSNFRNALHALRWETVLNKQTCNEAFDEFWDVFQTFYNLHFPLTKQKFNKKIHKINCYMTKGLLVSRVNKIKSYKKYIFKKNVENLEKFKNYLNLYNRLVRLVKRGYYHDKVENCKNPKMVWEVYNELTNRNSTSKIINELNINGITTKDDLKISEHFNDFFSTVGPVIADSIPKTNTDPVTFLQYPENVPKLKFGEIGPIYISEVLKTFEPKKSMDMDGISVKIWLI